jgi:hypothetical protein
MYTGRASRFAGSAAQTKLKVGLEGPARINPVISRGAHQLDAPARAVHFGVQHGIGWAGRQTETTVNTLVKQLLKLW